MIRVFINDDGELEYINTPDIDRDLFPMEPIQDPTEIIIDPTDTDVEIDGESGKRYKCGTLDSLEITPPDEGLIDVLFTSGETPTDVDIPESVIFNAELVIESNTVYEISILDGIYGAWLAWPVPEDDEDTPGEGGAGE